MSNTNVNNPAIHNILTGDEVVVKSYYVVKHKGYAGDKDKYVASGFEKGEKLVLVDDILKAKRFEYFGLKGMETALLIATNHVGKLMDKGIDGLIVESRDVTSKIDDIDNLSIRRNMRSWRYVFNEDIIRDMIRLSKDKDGDTGENFITIYKFLSHLKMLPFEDIMEVAENWNRLKEEHQVKLAVGYAGEYNASRFILLMDCMDKGVKR